MGSSYVDNKKLNYHKRVGEAFDVNLKIFKRKKSNTFLENELPKTITLNNNYKTIRDIDFVNELNFKKIYLKDMNSDFGIYGFYNQKSGIISICHDNSCDYYLLKLIGEKKLQIYQSTMTTIIMD